MWEFKDSYGIDQGFNVGDFKRLVPRNFSIILNGILPNFGISQYKHNIYLIKTAHWKKIIIGKLFEKQNHLKLHIYRRIYAA